MRKRRRSEDHHIQQREFFRWIGFFMPREPVLRCIFAVPNGDKRDPITGARLKREGVKAGVWDVFVAVSERGYHGMWLEFKAGRDTLSEGQAQFERMATGEGYFCPPVVHTWAQAAALLEWYLRGRLSMNASEQMRAGIGVVREKEMAPAVK